jgi:2-haloacid dehalogenase
LNDLKAHAKLDFTHLFSAEQFGTYKPSPKVYQGAVNMLALEPAECVMVAAHLGDLKAAKACGLGTIYVERHQEEDWDADNVNAAKHDGTVDLWVSGSEDGFLTMAEELGIYIEHHLERSRVIIE